MTTRVYTTVDSPIGLLTLVAANGALAGVYMVEQRHRPAERTFGEPDAGPFGGVREQLAEYFAGARTTFDLPMALAGTQFQRRVWRELCEIPYGEKVTYGELAQRMGQPTASRAVGLANGKNPVSIVVPCHRVVGASGALIGYGGGLGRKQYLLELEERVSGRGVDLFSGS